MKVRATRPGFYLSLREEGERFEVPPRLFSARWMEMVGDLPEASPGEVNNALRQAETAAPKAEDKAEAARALLGEVESGMNFMKIKAAVKALTGKAPAKKDDAVAVLKALAEE